MELTDKTKLSVTRPRGQTLLWSRKIWYWPHSLYSRHCSLRAQSKLGSRAEMRSSAFFSPTDSPRLWDSETRNTKGLKIKHANKRNTQLEISLLNYHKGIYFCSTLLRQVRRTVKKQNE